MFLKIYTLLKCVFDSMLQKYNNNILKCEKLVGQAGAQEILPISLFWKDIMRLLLNKIL